MDRLLDDEAEEKQARYGELYDGRDMLYYLFGMDAIERLRESAKRFLRWITDHLQEPVRG